ncbi:MAG TPA: LysR family transcriptional regulator [Actinotalea caeni]|uniref:LysR family transcriptional regulator n=1 Tax=Actinotalea caeni TaxID=1348467 RepID=UPI0012E1B709|nr:LysR family transcriptional regulator [Actinotalea caeni]HLV54043.1 LysR family transcriptional regulator [Actinotalea caeni]
MLDVTRLKVFRAVVDTGSMQAAAAALGYTPSAVSQHVAALQRETGLTLLERRGRGVVATPAGLRLAAESAGVLGGLASLERLARDLREGRTGSLTLRYFASAGHAWVPGVIARLTEELPGLSWQLRLSELASDTAAEPDLEILVLQPGGEPPDPARYDVTHLLTEPYVVAVHADHPFARRAHVALTDLQDERWIDNDVTRGPCRAALLEACRAAGVVPRFAIETHDYASALAFVGTGTGVTVLPELGVRNVPPDVVVVPISAPTPTRTIVLCARRALRGHPGVERARELLLACAARADHERAAS